MSTVRSQSHSQAITNVSATIDLALIASLWCLTAIIVNPIGEFAIVDDSVYESIVRHFLETGEYRLTDVSTFPSVATTLWGSLFCLPLGISFTALRISTLAAALLGLIGVYTLVRDFRPSGPTALVTTLTVASNPVYYALSHSFMTDVPFAAMMTWAAVFLIRSSKSQSSLELLGGTLLALAATLSRQIALALPLAYAGTFLLRPEPGLRATLRAVLPSFICIGGLWAFNSWLTLTGRVPVMYGFWTNALIHSLSNPALLITESLSNVYATLLYLGLFLLPVQLFVGNGLRTITAALRTQGSRIMFVVGIIIMTSVIAARFFSGKTLLLPIDGHVLVKSGIGLLRMHDAEQIPSLPEPFWLALTAAGIFGAIVLIGTLSLSSKRLVRVLLRRATITDSEAAMTFLTLCAGLYLLPFLLTASSDRYVMTCIPLLAAVTVLSGTVSESEKSLDVKIERLASVIFIAMAGIFSVIGTRDYLEWNRLRWQAADDLMQEEHARPEEIDGGTEFNGEYRVYPADMEKTFQTIVAKRKNLAANIATASPTLRRQLATLMLFGWRTPTTPYLISFGPVPGYSVVKKYTYPAWMSSREQSVIALRKD